MTDFRAKARQFFKALSPCAASDYSEYVCTVFQRNFDRLFPVAPKIVALYEPMKGEIEVTLLMDFLKNKSIQCVFPDWKNKDPDQMSFGVDPASIDLVFVPGLAFSVRGERMGRGLGYYDRFLPKATKAVRVALTYDELLRDHIPQEKWDMPVHYIFTQTRVIDCKS